MTNPDARAVEIAGKKQPAFKCDECGKPYGSADRLAWHLAAAHNIR